MEVIGASDIGLTPIATIGANDNASDDTDGDLGPVDSNCDQAGIDASRAQLAAITAQQVSTQTLIGQLEDFRTLRQTQFTQVQSALVTARGFRAIILRVYEFLIERSLRIIDTTLGAAQDRLIALDEQVITIEAAIAEAQAICDTPPEPADLPSTPASTGEVTLNFLHADHLGRPVFATDINGEIVWDGGITTPFGVQIETMGALTQSLMFPGQYEDLETGYYQNWHRTYDPMLGRYLQSDPIGLAGGLNRYAYVGGNPMNYVDPTGLNGTLFIYAHENLSGNSSGVGHSFLVYEPDEPDSLSCEQCSFSFWPAGSGSPELGFSRDGLNIDFFGDTPSSKDAVYSQRLNADEEKILLDAVNSYVGDSYSLFSNNCTTFAIDVWNQAGSKDFNTTIFPSSLVNLIRNRHMMDRRRKNRRGRSNR